MGKMAHRRSGWLQDARCRLLDWGSVSARHNHLLSFDNLSYLSNSISDTLCQLATGGGLGTRRLYSDEDELLISTSCPIVLNGIENVAVRPDLADRSVFITLEPIPEQDRRLESELWASFETQRSRILGALLDAIDKHRYQFGLSRPIAITSLAPR